MQQGIVDRYLKDNGAGPLLDTLARATSAARAAGVAVIYVRVAFRPGAPEISARNKSLSAARAAGGLSMEDSSTQVHPAIAPHDGDIVVVKKRVSAFSGSDLDVVLRSLDVDSLVFTGISTSGVVLSTLRQAADLDYQLTVLEDGCADLDAEVHRVLLGKVFPRQASVVTTNDGIAALKPAGR